MVTTVYGHSLRASNDRDATLSISHGRCHPGLVDHPLVTPDVQVTLLAAVSETGDIALGDLVGLLPAHPQPLSAVVALVDAGLLALDLASSFDASCRVRRSGAFPAPLV